MACLVSSQALTRMSSSIDASGPGLLGIHHLGLTGEDTESSFGTSLDISCWLVPNLVAEGHTVHGR